MTRVAWFVNLREEVEASSFWIAWGEEVLGVLVDDVSVEHVTHSCLDCKSTVFGGILFQLFVVGGIGELVESLLEAPHPEL